MLNRHAHERRRLLVGVAIACLALAGALLESGAASADGEAHRLLKGFQRSGQYILYVGGNHIKKAKLYHSQLAAAYLILESPFDEPLLVSPRTRSVQEVPEDKMVEREDGNIYFLEDVKPADVGTFRFDRGHVVFTVDGKTGRLQPNPPLLGLKDADDLVEHTPEYVRDGKSYKLNEETIEELKAHDGKVEVLVVFGSWCPSCKRFIPYILKMDRALEGSDIEIRYHGLPRPPAAWRDPAFRNTGLKRLPAVVVTAGGRVLGKLSGTETGSPETNLLRILK